MHEKCLIGWWKRRNFNLFLHTVLLVIEVAAMAMEERPEKWSKNLPASGFFSTQRLWLWAMMSILLNHYSLSLIKVPYLCIANSWKTIIRTSERSELTAGGLASSRRRRRIASKWIFQWLPHAQVCSLEDFMPTHTGQHEVYLNKPENHPLSMQNRTTNMTKVHLCLISTIHVHVHFKISEVFWRIKLTEGQLIWFMGFLTLCRLTWWKMIQFQWKFLPRKKNCVPSFF